MNNNELLQLRILCATYPRCGSHLLRTAFKQMTGIDMVPTHNLNQHDEFDYVVTILRNPKDSIISRVAMHMHFDDSKPIEYYIEKAIFEYVDYYDYLYNHADHIFIYEDLLENTKDIVKILCDELNASIIQQSFIDDVTNMSDKKHLKSSKVSPKYDIVVNAINNFDFEYAEQAYAKLYKKAKKSDKIIDIVKKQSILNDEVTQ